MDQSAVITLNLPFTFICAHAIAGERAPVEQCDNITFNVTDTTQQFVSERVWCMMFVGRVGK